MVSDRASGLALALAAMACAPVARAQVTDAKLVVCVSSAQDGELVARLRGQLSDVAVELVPMGAACAAAGDFDAAEFARVHAAEAVLWFEVHAEPAPELRVQLWAVEHGALPVRAVQNQSARRSELLEAAALVARSSVVAFLRERAKEPPEAPRPMPAPSVIGAPTTEGAAPAAPIAPPSAAPPSPPPSPPSPHPESEVAEARPSVERSAHVSSWPQLRSRFFVGVQSVVDGVSDLGQHALAARFGLNLSFVTLSVYGSASVGSSVSNAWVDLRLTRHTVGLAIDAERQLGGSWRGAAGLHAGTALYLRSSVPKDPQVGSTGTALLAAFAFGPEVSLEYRPSTLGVGLHLALDVLPAAPSFQLQTDRGAAQTLHEPWTLEPRVALGLAGRL